MKQRKPQNRFNSSLYDCFSWIPVGLSVFTCTALLFARLMVVSGHSMLPTLQHGDLMITSGLGYQPQRGDIVVLNDERFYHGQPIVKRVIAIEGDCIDINFERGEVILNGSLLDEPYTAEPTFREEGTPLPQVVPEGCVFVMGDNRNHSDDSRHSDLGMVDTRYIIGKVRLVLPTGQIAQSLQPQKGN